MIYNDVQERLKLIYASIDQKNDYHEVALGQMNTGFTDGAIIISFYKEEEVPALRNQINNVIANLANIKDCLKKKMVEKGNDEKQIESEINNSIYLQLVIDLANQEKHGYPLTKTKRSKKDPLIKNIARALTASNKKDNVTVKRSDGAGIHNCMTTIVAEITDSKGNLLYYLDDLINNALNNWENIIKKYNIT